MSKNIPKSSVEDETKSSADADNFTEDRVPNEEESLTQPVGNIELDLPIDSDKAAEFYLTEHADKIIHDTPDMTKMFCSHSMKTEMCIPSRRPRRIHLIEHDEIGIHKTEDKFGSEIKYGVRPSTRVLVPHLDERFESLGVGELDVPIVYGKDIDEISVVSITEDNMNMRPWPVAMVPPPPPDPPNPN